MKLESKHDKNNTVNRVKAKASVIYLWSNASMKDWYI